MTVPPSTTHPSRPVTPITVLAAKLGQVTGDLEAVPGIEPAITTALREAYELASGLEPYLSRCTTPESPALSRLARRTRATDWNHRAGDRSAGRLEQEMLSGHVEGQTLKMLVRLTRANRVLDIGMFTGYSALAMAEALPEQGEVVACEVDADVAAFAQECFQGSEHGGKITVRVAPALGTLAELSAAGETFDLVFIDADKAGYVGYLTVLLDTGLLAPHGLICADNTLMQGQPYLPGRSTPNGDAIEEFNRVVTADTRVEQVVLPLRDGLTLIRRV